MARPKLLTEEIEFWLGSMTDTELGKLCDVYPSTIQRWRRDLDIPACRVHGKTYARDVSICAMLLEVQNAADVARLYRLTRERIRHIAYCGGLRMRWVAKNAMQEIDGEGTEDARGEY